MRYEFILAHEGKHMVKRMCNALEVGRSGYYYWRKSRPSQREQANKELVEQIKEVYQVSRRTYGSPRVYKALKRKGILCGRNRVARLMRMHNIVGQKPRRRFPVTTQRRMGALAAPNLLNQNFSADGPNQKWVTDITYIDTAEGWLYLAPVLDLFSRMVVGWAMADHMETSLVENALCLALARRSPAPGWIHHSDQGSQYTSEIYQQRLTDDHCQVSMSRVGNCYDNATMESFIATIKKECVTYQFATREDARTAIFEYIEVWYNRRRLHSSLDYLSPLEFEQSQDITCVQ
jgi:transposase InsO family protein